MEQLYEAQSDIFTFLIKHQGKELTEKELKEYQQLVAVHERINNEINK